MAVSVKFIVRNR